MSCSYEKSIWLIESERFTAYIAAWGQLFKNFSHEKEYSRGSGSPLPFRTFP